MRIDTLTSPKEAGPFVHSRVEEGSDFIKIIWESGSDGTWRTLDEETVAALIQAAHERSKLAVVHATQERFARRAIELGADGLAHIFGDEPPSDDFGKLIVDHDAFVIPTLSVIAGGFGITTGAVLTEQRNVEKYLMPQQISSLRMPANYFSRGGYENAQAAVRLIHDAGAPVLAGTDVGNPGVAAGASMHREIELLHECGLDEVEALAAATSVPATIFGLSDRGVVAEGKLADLVLVEGVPSRRLSDTRKIAAVIKRGAVFNREDRAVTAAQERERIALLLETSRVDVGDGTISDLEDGLVSAFGFGWSPMSDQMLGGNSSATIEVIDDGARGSSRSMLVQGETREGHLFPWAGAAFSPGERPMEATNLSHRKGVRFWAKGNVGTYSLAITSASRGFFRVSASFDLNQEWKEFEFTFSELELEAVDVTSIGFLCYEKRPFRLQVDEIELL